MRSASIVAMFAIAFFAPIIALCQVQSQACGTATSPVDPEGNEPGGGTSGNGACRHANSADALAAAEQEMLSALFGPCQLCPPFPSTTRCASSAQDSGGTPTFAAASCTGGYMATWTIPAGTKISRSCAGC